MRLLVYAITDSARIAPVSAAGGVQLTNIRVGRLTALVASRRNSPAVSPRALRRYHQTIAAIADAVPAILPMRFATLVDDEELEFILRTRAASLRAALQRVRGCVQMTVRVVSEGETHAPGAFPIEIRDAGEVVHGVASRRPGVTEGPGRRYLRSRVPPEDRETRRLLAPLRQGVRRWVKDEQVMSLAGVTSVYHLVPRQSATAYARALQTAARIAGLGITVSGPFPPYAFAAAL